MSYLGVVSIYVLYTLILNCYMLNDSVLLKQRIKENIYLLSSKSRRASDFMWIGSESIPRGNLNKWAPGHATAQPRKEVGSKGYMYH